MEAAIMMSMFAFFIGLNLGGMLLVFDPKIFLPRGRGALNKRLAWRVSALSWLCIGFGFNLGGVVLVDDAHMGWWIAFLTLAAVIVLLIREMVADGDFA